MSAITILCPAKINLFLAVGAKDLRGYHPIRTIFQAVSLYDELTLTPADKITFECNDASVPAENTVVKAVRLLQEVSDFPPVAISLIKNIPSQAGLGGASSDAAGAILAADKLCSAPLEKHERNAIARAVGMDVSFFLHGGRAKGTGYGEIIEPLPPCSPPEWYVLVQPNKACSTVAAYKAIDEFSYEFKDFPNEDVLYNDFERTAPCESIDLQDRLLTYGARDAGLSGSGSAIFGRYKDEKAAMAAAERMKHEAPWVAVVHSI
jgi:4-diphosphocytidyl-2-C-methyl-D-erythritol kinase